MSATESGRPGSADRVSDPVPEARAALALLTRLPMRPSSTVGPGGAAFGLVGALLGLAASVPLVILGGMVPPMAAILAIATMTLLTGALHLDGLADSADALLAPDPVTAERARKDPSLGVGGVAAVVLVLALEATALASLATGEGALVAAFASVAAGACSRTLAVVMARAAGSGPGSLGSWFAGRISRHALAVAVATAVGATGLAGWLAGSGIIPAGAACGSAIGAGMSLWIMRARRQLDGDGLGATVELAFCAVLVSMAALAAWPG